jgi:hypothetical protein
MQLICASTDAQTVQAKCYFTSSRIPLLRNLFDKFSGIRRVLHKFLARAQGLSGVSPRHLLTIQNSH